MANYKITLHQYNTLPRKILPSLSYMIKVPNFFIMHENDDKEVQLYSPSFEFAGSTWQFLFESRGEYSDIGIKMKTLEASLERLDNQLLERYISYSILLLDADDEKHGYYCDKDFFHEYSNDCSLHTFRNDNIFYDKRETLTLIVHLICDEIPDVKTSPRSPLTDTGMTEDCRIFLSELPKKTLSSVNFMLKVPNFFSLSYIGSKSAISSQPFEFCNASWQFSFIPDAIVLNETFSLYLVRLDSEIRNHWISCTIVLWDEDNHEHDHMTNILLYKENANDFCAWTINDLADRGQDTMTFIAHLICEKSPEQLTVQKLLKKQLEEDFKKLLLNGKNHDLTLRVAEKEFRVHKDVLIVRSPAFESILSSDMTETNKSFIDMPDCDPQIMEKFLFYIYCGKLDILNIVDAIGLYYIADKYSMALVKKQCSHFIKKFLSPQMICDVVKLSINHSDSDLLEYATEYFRNHMHDIFTTPKWMSFLTEDVTTANELLVKASKRRKNFKPVCIY